MLLFVALVCMGQFHVPPEDGPLRAGPMSSLPSSLPTALLAGGGDSFILIRLDDFPKHLLDVETQPLGDPNNNIATPEIDAIAADGIRFTQHHTPGICGPTTNALLAAIDTGAVGPGAFLPQSTATLPWQLNNSHTTISVGKVSTGCTTTDCSAETTADGQGITPILYGFDNAWGYDMSASVATNYGQYPRFSATRVPYANTETAEGADDDPFFHHEVTDQALTRIAAATGPYFLWYGTVHTHGPFLDAPFPPASRPYDQGASCTGGAASQTCIEEMTEDLDSEIGQLLAGVDLENTWIFIVSDDGDSLGNVSSRVVWSDVGSNGRKGSSEEGGANTTLIVRPPDRLTSAPRGVVFDDGVHTRDIPVTIADLAGKAWPGTDFDGNPIYGAGESFADRLTGVCTQPNCWTQREWYYDFSGLVLPDPKVWHQRSDYKLINWNLTLPVIRRRDDELVTVDHTFDQAGYYKKLAETAYYNSVWERDIGTIDAGAYGSDSIVFEDFERPFRDNPGASTGLTATTLTNTGADWIVNRYIGWDLNPDTSQGTTFTVASNTATVITAAGDMTTVAVATDTYELYACLDGRSMTIDSGTMENNDCRETASPLNGTGSMKLDTANDKWFGWEELGCGEDGFDGCRMDFVYRFDETGAGGTRRLHAGFYETGGINIGCELSMDDGRMHVSTGVGGATNTGSTLVEGTQYKVRFQYQNSLDECWAYVDAIDGTYGAGAFATSTQDDSSTDPIDELWVNNGTGFDTVEMDDINVVRWPVRTPAPGGWDCNVEGAGYAECDDFEDNIADCESASRQLVWIGYSTAGSTVCNGTGLDGSDYAMTVTSGDGADWYYVDNTECDGTGLCVYDFTVRFHSGGATWTDFIDIYDGPVAAGGPACTLIYIPGTTTLEVRPTGIGTDVVSTSIELETDYRIRMAADVDADDCMVWVDEVPTHSAYGGGSIGSVVGATNPLPPVPAEFWIGDCTDACSFTIDNIRMAQYPNP